MKIKSKAKATIALMASLLVGSAVGSLLHLTNTVYAEGTVGVRFTAVDNEHPDEKVSYPGIAIVNSNGEVYKYDSMVPDTKFDLTNKPTTDPSGGTLYRSWNDSAEIYKGYGDGVTDISAMADHYYWDGSTWLENYPDGLGQASSTGYWYASKYTTTDIDLITGAEITSYYWSVSTYNENYVYNNLAYLPEGDYTLILNVAPTSYTDAGGTTHYMETYEFEQSEINFSVGTTPSTVTVPVRRIEKQTVTVSTKDASNPDDSVNQAEYLLFDDAGNLINTSGVSVPDEKLDISNIPTVDPSGYPLTASSNGEYTGREYATTSAYFPTYFWNGSSWQRVTIPSSTGCWQAYAQNNGSTTTWTVHLVKEAENTSSWNLPAGNYKLTVEEVPTAYIDSQGVWHYTENTSDKFFYEAEQSEINFMVADQPVDVVIPVKRTTFFKINSTFKDTNNPSYQFNDPQYQIFNENGELYKSASKGVFEPVNDMDDANVPTVDPDGGALVKASYTSNEHDAYEGTVFTSEHSYEDFYWNGTDWQEEAIPSSTGYWEATIQKNYHTDESTGNWVPYEWYWAVRWDSNVIYGTSYLAPGNYVLVPGEGNEPTSYNDNGTWHYDYEDNFKYEYVRPEIPFTVTADATIEIPIEKIQSYRITINPTDRDDATKQPSSFYFQLFNEEGQIYDGNEFQDDLKLDFSNAPTTDPVGGELKFEGVTSYGRKIYKGTSYDSEPDVYAHYSWNGSEWRKYGLPSSTGYWYAYLQSEYHTDESTGQWVAYKWHWAVTVDAAKEQSGDTFSLPAGNYTLRILTVPSGYQDAEGNWHGGGNEGYYKAEQSEVSFTVENSDITVDVPFVRHERYKTYADMKDSKSSDYTYGDNISGYIKSEEGKYYYFFGDLPNGFYADTGVDYGTPTTDPDGGSLTYQYSETYYGPLFAEPQNGGTYYWNGSAWIDEPLFSLKGTWVATYVQTNGSYCWKVKNATSDALVSLGNGNYTWLESGTYTFVPVVYPTYMYQNGNSTWIERDDVKPIEPVTFTVNGAETTFDVIIERIPSRAIILSLVDKDDTAYKVYIKNAAKGSDSAIYRVKNLDTGKYLGPNGEERDLIVASKANIPAVDPVGGSTKIKENSTFDGLPVYTGTEYTSNPQIRTTYYWTGSKWVTSSESFYNGAWSASIDSEGRYDSEQGTWVTDKWYWQVRWNNYARGCTLGASSSPLITIKGTGNFQIEELVPPSGYISPDGVTVTGSVYKKINPVQLTITDDSPDEINITLEYERIPLSEKMPEAGERASMLLTLTGCLAMIALAFTATRSRRKKVVG